MKYTSLFSGIECASLAAKPLGWEPVCFAEIDPFPAAVLAHHYPGVPNVGDVTAVDWTTYRGAAELVIGGSPCQAFSVAGRRESLADARGNLTLAFVEAVNAIDPTFVVWENVPGVLSTKDNAFGCFLADLVGADDSLQPLLAGKWPGVGVAAGPRRVVAWRILDAQYFGVPQRRRRVFLVGCSGASGIDPAEILFEREGLRGDSAPRREAGEDIAGTFKSRTRSGGWSHDVDLAAAGYMQVAPTVTGGPPYSRTGNDRVECEALVIGAVSSKWAKGTSGPSGDECQNLVAHTLSRRYDSSEDGCGRGTPMVLVPSTGVRRLTPRECERLQGLPDDYTLIPYRGKPAADGPRYKAIGNGMAVPCVRWIFERIENVVRGIPARATAECDGQRLD